MKKKITFLIAAAVMLLTMMASTTTAWGQTYKLEQVTSVEAGGLYVFEQSEHVMNNNTSSSALQTTTTYNTTGLAGTETYVWTLETATNGFYMKNVSLTSNQYLNNASSTGVSFGNKSSIWAFNFQTDNTVLIQNKSNSDRFLGYTNATSYAYKAYATSNLSTYAHAVVVYQLVPVSSDAPSISAENVNIEYNASSGTIEYTVNNAVSGGVITASVASEWLTAGTVTSSTVPFTCTTNTAATARTATVTLTYTYNAKQTVTKNVIVTQAGNPNVVDNIEDITAAGTYTIRGTIVAKSQRGFIVGDGTGYVYYYNTGYDQTAYNIGDKVKLAGSVVAYGGVLEFNSSTTVTSSETSNYVAEDPTVLSGSDMDARVASTTPAQLSSYVQYVGTLSVSGTYYNITDIDGAETAQGSISFPIDTDFTSLNGKQVTVTGYYVGISSSKFYNTMIGTIEEVAGSVATPTFSPEAGTYATAQTVTISCATENVDIYYTTNGDDPDDESTHYDGPITVSTTTTIKAIAFDSNDNTSAIASATYTITAPMTIAEARAQGTGSVLTRGIVTSCVGTTGYIQDATAAICVYGTDLTVGDEITVSGTLKTYKGLLEITSPQVTVNSHGNTVTPTVKTIAEINTDYAGDNALQGWFVKIENATVTAISGSGNQQNTTIEQDENTIVVRGNLNTATAVVVGDIITLDGNIGCFDAAQIANPQNVTIYVNNDPVINADNIEIAYDAVEGVVNYTITNPVEGVTLNANCEANWISNIVVGEESITFTCTENEGEEDRTATITLSYTGADDKEVTVTQGHYTVDYATLPFEFDGGRADIETTDGLTHEGLDSDYASSPKLKFKTTGTWVLLHFNEVPGALTYTIKGNSFSGGTFTVQTSEDGVTYTDLTTYTAFGSGNDALNETFENLGANVRYIKWIYTEKSSGNVGLGNIVLYKEGGGPVVEAYNLTVEPYENLELFVFVEDENNPGLEEAGTIQVNEGDNVMLSVTANEGYVMQSLKVDGVEHVNDITEEATYTFQMPGHDVTIIATAVEDVPFVPVTYTLATTVESGKSYIIVGGKTVGEETTYYAMGEQRNNNRGAASISVDGNTATVSTADVYEFVISTDETDNSLFNIYDAVNYGYLYAAGGTSSNHLKTTTTIDGRSQWAIVIDQDGIASIVANFGNEKADPRNTMRFNSSNNPPIFSCYAAENTMNDIYLYVKDENPEFVTQTIELVEGWNWVSFYVEGEPQDLLAQLETSLGENGLIIQALTAMTEYDGDPEEPWFGTLDDIGLDNDQMYLIKTSAACTVQITGTPADPATHEITINPGWNWIGFPSAEAIDVLTAMSDFEAENEDKIQAMTGMTEYDDSDPDEPWFGTLETLEPGMGLLYFSSSNQTKTLIFNIESKRSLTIKL